jgi:hypothetical protein
MDEARAMGLKVAVCSAATKSSVIYTLTNLLGEERFQDLDCFLAGDDVPKKKPDPIIYQLAAGTHFLLLSAAVCAHRLAASAFMRLLPFLYLSLCLSSSCLGCLTEVEVGPVRCPRSSCAVVVARTLRVLACSLG